MNSLSSPPELALTRDQIQQRVHELGQWFHNLDLRGVRTAPDHFLGDYANVKWRKIAPAIPADLSGKTVLDLIHEHVAEIYWCSNPCSAAATKWKSSTTITISGKWRCSADPVFRVCTENRCAGAPTNWWIPNRAGAEAMLRSAGFEISAHPEEEVYICHSIELPNVPDGPRSVYPAKI
jgi:hypothetical protein